MIGATVKELTEHYRLGDGTVRYWIKEWDDSTDHPFPKPFAKVQFRVDNPWGWTRHRPVYRLHEVSEWRNGLRAAQKRKRQRKALRAQWERPVLTLQPIDSRPLEDALAKIKALRAELEQVKVQVAGKPVDWPQNF